MLVQMDKQEGKKTITICTTRFDDYHFSEGLIEIRLVDVEINAEQTGLPSGA